MEKLLLGLHAIKVLHVLLVGWIDAELLMHLVKLLGVEGWLLVERGGTGGHGLDKAGIGDNVVVLTLEFAALGRRLA